jgi:hypothetical protein
VQNKKRNKNHRTLPLPSLHVLKCPLFLFLTSSNLSPGFRYQPGPMMHHYQLFFLAHDHNIITSSGFLSGVLEVPRVVSCAPLAPNTPTYLQTLSFLHSFLKDLSMEGRLLRRWGYSFEVSDNSVEVLTNNPEVAKLNGMESEEPHENCCNEIKA